jgi:hypothetical protein
MAIVIRMADQSEYLVAEEYTLKDFQDEVLDMRGEYLQLTIQSGSITIPTILAKDKIISIQDRESKSAKALRFKG